MLKSAAVNLVDESHNFLFCAVLFYKTRFGIITLVFVNPVKHFIIL